MEKNIKISIVIVTYNSDKIIEDCLNSIYKHNDLGNSYVEIIIVDNNSLNQKDMFSFIRSTYPDDIILIGNDNNSGYGTANNIGIKKAKGNLIIIMNPDVRLVNDSLSLIVNHFESNSELGILGGKDMNSPISYYIRPEYLNIFYPIQTKIVNRINYFNPNTMFISGSFSVFRKEFLFQAGLYDENIFLYNEEADISKRFMLLNKSIVFDKHIKIHHLVHGRTFNSALKSAETTSLIYYLNKYDFSVAKVLGRIIFMFKVCLFVALFIGNTSKIQIFKSTIRVLKEKRAIFLNQLKSIK